MSGKNPHQNKQDLLKKLQEAEEEIQQDAKQRYLATVDLMERQIAYTYQTMHAFIANQKHLNTLAEEASLTKEERKQYEAKMSKQLEFFYEELRPLLAIAGTMEAGKALLSVFFGKK